MKFPVHFQILVLWFSLCLSSHILGELVSLICLYRLFPFSLFNLSSKIKIIFHPTFCLEDQGHNAEIMHILFFMQRKLRRCVCLFMRSMYFTYNVVCILKNLFNVFCYLDIESEKYKINRKKIELIKKDY